MIDFTSILEKANALGNGANYSGTMHKQMMLDLIAAIQSLEGLIPTDPGSNRKANLAIIRVARNGSNVLTYDTLYNDVEDTLTLSTVGSGKFKIASDNEFEIELVSAASLNTCGIYKLARTLITEVIVTTLNFAGSEYTGAFGNVSDLSLASATIVIHYPNL